MLGSPILYLKGMRILMFQLSGFYYTLTYQHPYLVHGRDRIKHVQFYSLLGLSTINM